MAYDEGEQQIFIAYDDNSIRRVDATVPNERLLFATVERRPLGLVMAGDFLFVGIDVIGPYITEINVTSPTGIRALEKLGGGNAAAAMWTAIEAKRGG